MLESLTGGEGAVSEQDRKARIKVVDRRWFTQDGELRRDRPAPEPRPARERVAPDEEGTGTAQSPSEATREPGEARGGVSWPSAVSFLQLVDFLAQQALVLLQGAQGIPANPDQARIFIDFLGILEDRTRGNLSPDEARALSDVLFQLRTLYVRLAGR